MLGLLQRKPEPCGRLDIRRATQVFDAVPCDVFEPQPLLVQTGLAHRQAAQLLKLDPDPERKGGRTSVSAAVLVMVSRWRVTASTAS